MNYRLGCALLIALAGGCTIGETMDAGPDASPIDAQRPPPPPDTGPPDAGPPDAYRPDSGPCEDNFDCPIGQYCLSGTCGNTTGNCCEGDECPFPAYCDYYACECFENPPSCCDDPSACLEGTVCSEWCTCDVECDPACAIDEYCSWDGVCVGEGECYPECLEGEYCDFGSCRPLCERDGCPEGDLCTFGGCITPLCTPAECAVMEPIRTCYPEYGCIDECTELRRAECAARDLGCAAGFCVDRSCGDGASPCEYATDCCGASVCQRVGDPPPACGGEPCPAIDAPPSSTLCTCDEYASCIDLWEYLDRTRF